MYKNTNFHKVGTKHKAYVDRFHNKYAEVDKFEYLKVDSNNIEIFWNKKKIDKFTSKSTFNQFILILESFNLIERGVGCYKVIQQEYNFDHVTNAIFEYSNDLRVQRYRNSRKISFLVSVNIIREDNLRSLKISKTKGKITIKDIKAEISTWEKEARLNLENANSILERMKNEN